MSAAKLPNIVTAAAVALDKTVYKMDTLYTYLVPDGMDIRAGMRVVVPFGRGSRSRIGLVFAVGKLAADSDGNIDTSRLCSFGEKRWSELDNNGQSLCPVGRLKAIYSAADDEPVLSEELLRLCHWIRDNTFCTFFDAFRAILPPGLGYTLRTHYELASPLPDDLSAEEKALVQILSSSADRQTLDELASAQQNTRVFKELVEKGVIMRSEQLKRRVGDEMQVMLRLAESDEPPRKLTPKQKSVMEFVEGAETASLHEISYACTVSPSVVKRLVEMGLLEQYEQQIFRTEPSEQSTESLSDLHFSPAQQKVFDGLLELMNNPEPKCALLRGVTGSGKTSVFIKLIEQALLQGKSAIMLVPEISLTPQMVSRFRRLFGGDVAIMHSSLSLGERADEYTRIKQGKARIVIGTRSAVFAPVQNLGIIVIDEEGESTYKSESAPRYHARDIAKQRCFAHNAFLLLASATPAIESRYYAEKGRYTLFQLDERYNNAVLPEVFMTDMRTEAENGNHSEFSEPLIEAVNENLSRGEQSILLLNRRGYHTSVRCASCGAAMECPNCSVPLTYHKANDSVICHYCGYMRRAEGICEKCGSKFLMMKGTGTQRIEDEISEIFPEARILRMDADTTSTKNSFEKKLKAFADHEYDIIVGTQMIAKGLDFPDVTLVGVLRTDNSLYASDFKAYERTFSLITQVVGRSGRAGKRGRAYLQTFSPEHYVLNLAAEQNYEEFFRQEIELREALVYPPFCDILSVGFSGLTESAVFAAAKAFAEKLNQNIQNRKLEIPINVLGPARYAVSKVNGRFRCRLMIKCRNSKTLRALISAVLEAMPDDPKSRNISCFADMNGEA